MKPLPHDNDPLGERDPLWPLLGRAPLAEPDAWFTVRTLSRIRREGEAAKTHPSFRRIWRWALGGIGVCAALAFSAVQTHTEQQTKQKNVQEAFEIMASFDSDTDSSASPSWQESAL